MEPFADARRVLASVVGLCLYALNEVRMFNALPRTANPGDGQTHALGLQIMGASEQVYASVLDLALRWGLVGLTLGLCLWALAETLPSRSGVKN